MEMAKAGLRLNHPFLPRANKSVTASMLEREGVLVPKYQYDYTDPFLTAEVVYGNGEVFHTGSAAGPGPQEELQADMVCPWGPGSIDFNRFLCGAQGYVAWEGTQCFPGLTEYEDGEKAYGGATVAVIGDLKKMSPEYLRAASVDRYGVSLFVGIGIPIPVLDEDLMAQLAVGNDKIFTDISDYSVPERTRPNLGRVSYAELRSGSIELNGRKVPTAPMSSLKKAREIAQVLKDQVQTGQFLLTERVAPLDLQTKKQVLDERSYEA